MQTITKTYQTYRFEELDDKAKEQVLESYRTDEWYPGDWWHEAAVEDFVEDRTKEGWDLETKDVHFSGFWSQGDGASFDGEVTCETWIKFHKLEAKFPTIMKVLHNTHPLTAKIYTNHFGTYYCHSNTRYLEIEEDGQLDEHIYGWDDEAKEQAIMEKWNEEVMRLEEILEDNREELSQQLYSKLEKQYDYYMTDEAIKEDIMSNDNMFLANGTPFNK